jgi:Arc/MetJ-type ribon-helix-helix transcriptional regulator
MARIDISEPYEQYLNSLVKAGLFRSITAAAEAAIYKQMIEAEKMRVSSIAAALAKGEADIQSGKTIPYTDDLMDEISKKGKEAAIKRKPVKRDVKP